MLRIIFSLLLLSPVAQSQEHLEPEDSQFSPNFFPGYTNLVLTYLGSAYEDDVIVRLIGFPSFSPEYALGIKKYGKKYHIFYEAPKMQLWAYQMMPLMEDGEVQVMNDEGEFVKDEEGLKNLEQQYPKEPKDIPRETCTREVPEKLAVDLQYIWQEMLYRTRYPREPTMGLDGETYHFSARMEFGTYAGKVWSPEPGSKTGKLVDIAYLMSDYCLKKAHNKRSLEKKVAELRNELGTNELMQPNAKAPAD